jgi:hypothetical protein
MSVNEISLTITTATPKCECTSLAEFLRIEIFQRKLYLLSNVFKIES